MKLLLPFLLLALISCGPDKENFNSTQYTLAYVDISDSQDSTSIAKMTDQIFTVFANQPLDMDCRFVVRKIGGKSGDSPIYDQTISKLKRDTDRERNNHITTLIAMGLELKKAIRNEFDRLHTKPVSMETCICNTLENAATILAQKNTENTKLQLLIFSDMLEECKEKSSFFKTDFFMCKADGIPLKSIEDLKTIVQNYEPQTKISQFIDPENLYLINTGQPEYQTNKTTCLNDQDLKSIWEEIMVKMGYKSDDFCTVNGICFSNEISDRLLRKDDDQ